MINQSTDGCETVTNYEKGDKCFSMFSSEPKWIRRLHKFAEDYPNDVKITYTNKDGSINAELPAKWFKVSPPRKVSEEQKEKASQRFHEMWKEKKDREVSK